ncbi:MAG: thiamine pyrophosphate-dependent enzyme [Syntrophales bacterium]|nr:thiamine pyrophosphate-dependent enzyme [Syntrophales bacterium]MDD5641470.1 thiamine pyrophosphate-dependent enzyme [Syntrophales bacterium]
MKQIEQRILMGNEAIARGLIESGVTLAASYPGTPASEILQAVAAFAKEEAIPLHAEWSVNEKVAFETALANSYTGRRAAVSMKQVGLNVASDPFLRSAYLGVKGGLVVISADDPGPHSSQTEQDSRFFAMFAKVPVFDPSSPREAKEMVDRAFELSEKYEIPVMIRPTTRVCHARQNIPLLTPERLAQGAHFEKNPGRWCATPQYLKELHRGLNQKIEEIAGEEDFYPILTPGDDSFPGACIIASGVALAHTWDLLEEMRLLRRLDLYQVTLPYPLHRAFINNIKGRYQRVLVLEETYPVIELQLAVDQVQGRGTKMVPGAGELTPEVIRPVIEKFLDLPPAPAVISLGGEATRPTLCAGCGHRAAFYAIRETFPEGIFPSDIGCYTLGMNLGAVDTCHCMGAGISQAAGFYRAYAATGEKVPPIVATIGDSTFFHAGVPALINAVFHGARIMVVILDNATTAMTGHQPTPETGPTARGETAHPVLLADLVRACGAGLLKEADPYDLPGFMDLLQEAGEYCRGDNGGVAVVIAKHPCILEREARKHQPVLEMCVTEDCTGCRHCLDDFECPALYLDEATDQVVIDGARCIGCGVCVHVCPAGAIEAKAKDQS